MSSVSDRNRLNPQDKSRQLLLAVWHHHILINAIHWPTDPVVHLGGLTGTAKAIYESRLGHL